MTTGEKLCRQCGTTKPTSEFHANRSAASGLQAYCKDCNAETARQWREANPQRVRDRARRYNADPAVREHTTTRMRTWRANNPRRALANYLRQRYNLSLDAYDAMLEEQDGACAICRSTDVKLHVDHDHRCCPERPACGRCVRGLLCGYCNRALSIFRDDPANVEIIAAYLRRTEQEVAA